MSKLRLLFVKEAQASYISRLDLMRTFQRAFPRTELDIKHTQGYHPHPILSIVLPLPVGQSSDCELLDFEVTQEADGHGIADKLNTGMPAGLRVLDCYPAVRPIRDLAYLRADVTFEYDNGVPADAAARITELLRRPELVIQKRTKRKELADVDIAPMIQDVSFSVKKTECPYIHGCCFSSLVKKRCRFNVESERSICISYFFMIFDKFNHTRLHPRNPNRR